MSQTVPKSSPVPLAAHGYPRSGVHGRIVHAIGRSIVNGDIRPGDQLPNAATVRASRGVVREAVKVLAAKGLVVSRPRTGTRVRPPESWNLLDPDVLAWQQDGLPRGVFLAKLESGAAGRFCRGRRNERPSRRAVNALHCDSVPGADTCGARADA
jgi:DNA-binding transcriptional MocR family regulator